MSWSWLGASYHDQIVAPGKQPVFLLLVGLLAGFGFIRTSTRLIRAQVSWWPGNVSAGGVHLHHGGRRRYATRPRLLERATQRGARWNRRKNWLVTAVGGAPSQADPPQAS